MVARTRALAAQNGGGVHARVCAWEDLEPGGDFDTVFCVGNSLAHAADRRRALRAMAATLRAGGTLVPTPRHWERERALGSRVEPEGEIERVWTIAAAWEEPHVMNLGVRGVRERLTVYPFRVDT